MTRHDDIQKQAAEWLIRRDRGDEAPREQARFEAWLAADARHRAAYLELERTWRESDALDAWRPRDGTPDPAVLRSTARRSLFKRLSILSGRWPTAFAAALVIVALGALLWIATAGQVATYTTNIGGYQRVPLEDGSMLQLNTDTQLRVELAEHYRRVRLIRGEAFFQVAHDPARPFDVVAGDTTVHAVGTAFTVRLHSARDIEVVVTEGRVTLNSDSSDSAAAGTGRASAAAAVSAGERAIARPAGVAVGAMPQPEVARRLAWQEGELEFKGESLIQVVSEFNRYNRTRLEIVDPQLATLEVGGNFRATDLDAFVRALRSSFPVRTEETDGVIRLEARE